MPIPTYRPRSASFFLAPFAGKRRLPADGWNPVTGGIWPGLPAYPEAGAASSSSSSSSSSAIGVRLAKLRWPFALVGAIGSGIAGAGLGRSLGSPQHAGRSALIGGALGAAAGGGASYWVIATLVAPDDPSSSSVPNAPPIPPGPNEAGYEAPSIRAVDLTQQTTQRYENTGDAWPGATPPPPTGTDLPGGFTSTSSTSSTSPPAPAAVPWGWIVGGSLAALALGGAIWAGSHSRRRARRR